MKSAFGPRETALLFALAVLWGHSFLLIKIAVGTLGAAWVVTGRMLIGGALLSAIALLRRDPLPRDPRLLGMLVVIGVLGSAAPWAAQAWAARQLDSGLVAVLNACTPLATLGFAVALGQERLVRQRVLGIATAIAGTLIVVRGELSVGHSLLALITAVLATFGYAFAAVFTRQHITGRVATVPTAALQLVFGGLFLAPVAALMHGAPPSVLPLSVVGALLALGVLGTGVAFLIYFTLIERVGATNTSMVTYLVPVVAMVVGAVVRDEHFGPAVYIGACALIFGVWLAQRRPGTA